MGIEELQFTALPLGYFGRNCLFLNIKPRFELVAPVYFWKVFLRPVQTLYKPANALKVLVYMGSVYGPVSLRQEGNSIWHESVFGVFLSLTFSLSTGVEFYNPHLNRNMAFGPLTVARRSYSLVRNYV